MTNDVQATGPPVAILKVLRLRSPPEVLTVPWSTTVVKSGRSRRKKLAVPVAIAVPEVIALAVNTPPEAAAAKVAEQVRVAKSVLPARAALALAGGVPS